jgi:hypothetical protein
LVWESGWHSQNTDNTARKSAQSDGRSAQKVQNHSLPASAYDFLMSQVASEIVKEEGIILLDYRPLQIIWKGM